MIDYAEIYQATDDGSLALFGVIDDFSSVIWKSSYYGVGQFEIYAPATEANLGLLKGGLYVLTPNTGDKEVGVIERVEVTYSPDEGRMVAASGRFAKSMLDRRIIYSPLYDAAEGGNGYIWRCKPMTLSGKVDAAACTLVQDNATNPHLPNHLLKGDRRLWHLVCDEADAASKYPETITVSTSGTEEDAEKQVTFKNLLDYTDGLLEEYGLAARIELDRGDMRLHYRVYKGASRSYSSHPEGEPIVFSEEMDNLTSTEYVYDESAKKTTAFIGGEGEGLDRKCAFAYEYVGGMERREVFVDASSITTEVEEGETPPTMEEYRKQLEAQGQQTVAQSPAEETLGGQMDITNSPLEYRRDFNVGDVVTIEDSVLGLSTDVRILSVTEVQDEKGYNIDMEYGNK